MGIGMNIKARREALGMSQAKLAAMIGVHQQRVSYIESTDADLKFGKIKEYADALDTSVDALANGGSDVAE